MIVLDHVTKKFGNEVALSDVSFRIDPGEFLCVSGPSGCGKTVLLELLTGAMAPTSGTVNIDGVDLRKVPAEGLQLYRRRLGIVFQDGKLLPYCTVRENIRYPLEICGAPDAWADDRTNDVLQSMELTAHANLLPDALSAGDKARTGVARAIAHKPLIVLADEPTGNLDPVESTAILQMLRTIHARGTTVILFTHDMALVDVLQSRVVRLEQGKVVRDSVGGYERERRNQPKAAVAAGSHEFFGKEDVRTLMQFEKHVDTPPLPTDEEIEEHVAEAHTEDVPVHTKTTRKKSTGSGGKRKVHITSINS